MREAEGHTVPTRKTLKAWKAVFDTVNPKRVFEIGFNYGHSARIMLNHKVKLHSIDIGVYSHVLPEMESFERLYENYFTYEILNSRYLKAENYTKDFDMVFIDGSHAAIDLSHDLNFANHLETPYILVDDYNSRWFKHLVRLVDNYVHYKGFPYEMHSSYKYDASDGENTMVLLKRVEDENELL